MTKTKKNVLSGANLTKSFRSRPVVRGASIEVQQGEIVGLLGANGAGKTTCFYMLCGLIKPDSGKVKLGNENITSFPMYKRARLGIGYLPQEASIFRGMNVEDNIWVALEALNDPIDKKKKKLESLLSEFSISHLRKSPALSLSGGERRRVEIARALATEPDFILFDEPLAGIDPIAIHDIQGLVLHLKSRGIGVLITDHNVRETLDLVDRAYIMNEGKILIEGTPKQLIESKEAKRVYLGKKFNMN
ncbi:MAG: LPS export ABC transporter ATP-binding protein [Holosporaceae bacterium]|nr:MAG: LPS export ABC transporter ATP-binding protein [Holosporaceae bacterium]